MPIKLEVAEGYDFDASFREQLPALEKTMITHGLDPAAFTITKGPNSSYSTFYRGSGRYFDYDVQTSEDSFTVTYADDAGFLEYFLGACVAPDDADEPAGEGAKPRSQEQNHSSLMGRLAAWIHPRR
jgi:hypothetical protein